MTATAVATMVVGSYYEYNFLASLRGAGTFEGWTDFGWLIFTDRDRETRFYNPALLCTIRPERFDSTIAGSWGDES
jgi:hypothetical protein